MNTPSESRKIINLGVVFNDKKEILLIRRAKLEKGNDNSVLEWAFPGGKQEPNESENECVIREILEETGYKINPIKKISSRTHPQFPVIVNYYLCSLINFEPIQSPNPEEIAKIKWVNPKEIKNFITTDLNSAVAQELNLLAK